MSLTSLKRWVNWSTDSVQLLEIIQESMTTDPSLSDTGIWQWWIHTTSRTVFLQVWYLAVGWGLQEPAPARSGEQTAGLGSQQPAQPWHVEVMWLAWNQPWWEYVIREISTCFKSGLFYFRVPVYLLATGKKYPVIRPETGQKGPKIPFVLLNINIFPNITYNHWLFIKSKTNYF